MLRTTATSSRTTMMRKRRQWCGMADSNFQHALLVAVSPTRTLMMEEFALIFPAQDILITLTHVIPIKSNRRKMPVSPWKQTYLSDFNSFTSWKLRGVRLPRKYGFFLSKSKLNTTIHFLLRCLPLLPVMMHLRFQLSVLLFHDHVFLLWEIPEG